MEGMGWKGSKHAFKGEVWFHFLYGCNKSEKALQKEKNRTLIPLVEFFSKTFPTVYASMWRKKAGNYKRLPCDMQRRESRLMLEHVVARLAVEHPNVPCVTIHDSVMTTPDHIELVKLVILSEFEKIGVRQTLSVTRYDLGECE